MKIHLDKEVNQLMVYDQRFYNIEGTSEYWPSCTTVLGVYPKTEQFYIWLRQLGDASNDVLFKAGLEGSIMHDLIQDLLEGEEISMINEYGKETTSLIVWKMLCRFIEFTEYVDETILIEEKMVSDTLKVGGMSDWLVKINGENWLIDHKSSNNKQPTWKIQLSVYKTMLEEMGYKVDRIAVLWLKAKTRGPLKKGNPMLQGKNWQLLEYTDTYEDSMATWFHLRSLWDLENPNYKPRNLTMPNLLKVNIPVQKIEPFSDTEQPEKPHRKTNHIVNIKTGEEYSSIKEASDEMHFPYRRLCDMVKGRRENVTDLELCDT